MNERQRYLETILFGKPDKVPFEPGHPRESTLIAWHQQGLPEGAHYYSELLRILGITPPASGPRTHPEVSFRMIPTFEEKVLEHKDGHYIVQDWMGAITEISDQYDYTYIRSAKDFVTRKWHRFPVQTRADWEEMKWRFNSRDPQRYPSDFKERCRKMKDRNYVVGVLFNGPFWQLREWCGFEGLCMLFLDDPDFVEEMIDFWTNFVSETLRPILENVQLDYIFISEDMAYKEHCMISPEMTRKYLQPAWKRWAREARESDCPVVDMDSDGYVGELIPIWIESGINCSFPTEVAAGNDIVEYRQLYGKKMAYHGGIDKRAIAKGSKEMEAELMRIIPPLLKDGGFIPSCDHGVPPDISWTNFVEYARLLAKLTGWL